MRGCHRRLRNVQVSLKVMGLFSTHGGIGGTSSVLPFALVFFDFLANCLIRGSSTLQHHKPGEATGGVYGVHICV